MIKYKRILLKLSGEAFMGSRNYGIDEAVIEDYAKQIAGLISLKVQVAIVIGGGNIFRGLKGTSLGFDRVTGDQIGMLATIINSLALKSALINAGVKATVFTSIRMEPIGTFYTKEKAVEAMTNSEIAIIAGGTGNPYFTTDTASALRAIETEAEIMLKGTRVDGIYTADPEKDTKAKKFDQISYDEVYRLNLKVMDLTAITLCKENNLPLLVFNMNKKGSLLNILKGENIGTLVK